MHLVRRAKLLWEINLVKGREGKIKGQSPRFDHQMRPTLLLWHRLKKILKAVLLTLYKFTATTAFQSVGDLVAL